MQRLQAQELPVIQAKGLELEHFHFPVSSGLQWCLQRDTARGLLGGGGLAAGPCRGPHSHGPALPSTAHTVRASNTKSSKHKSLQLIRVHALTGQAHAAAVSGAQCFWGLSWGSPEQTRASLAMLSCGGPQPIFLRSL